MKATGIVRRIDDLGRIVIPKEIRKTLKVKEGMPLEIYTDQEGGIILKKYLPFSEFSSLAQEYAECILQQTGAWVLITDREKIIVAAGAGKGMKGQGISDRLEAILDDRNEQIPAVERTRFIPVADGMEAGGDQVYALIRSGGEIGRGLSHGPGTGAQAWRGAGKEGGAAIAAEFLGRQINV